MAGNHDTFGSNDNLRPKFRPPLHFLDGDVKDIDGISIAGISGIIGNPKRPWRKYDDDYLATVESALNRHPKILLMHDGPNSPEDGYQGSPRIRQTLEQGPPTLVVRGHSHWKNPLAKLSNGTQVLCVDARVVILRESST